LSVHQLKLMRKEINMTKINTGSWTSILLVVFVTLAAQQGVHATKEFNLHEAVKEGDVDKVEALIKKGADVNARDDMGDTPLLVAVMSNKPKVAKVLIDNKADVTATIKDFDSTALHLAALYVRDLEFVKAMLASLENKDERKNFVNAKNFVGSTALHYAASNKVYGKDIVDILIENGADIDAEDNHWRTACKIAKDFDNPEVVAILEQHGACNMHY